jgi:hypothetical protein
MACYMYANVIHIYRNNHPWSSYLISGRLVQISGYYYQISGKLSVLNSLHFMPFPAGNRQNNPIS